MLKFGLLYNNGGKWKGKPIVPSSWVDESFQAQVERTGGAYGYQFWLFDDTVNNVPVRTIVAVGNGDQRIFFDKKNDMVVVVNAGNYNKWNIPKNSTGLMREYIVPAVIKD